MLRLGKKSNIADKTPIYIILILLLAIFLPAYAGFTRVAINQKYSIPDNMDLILTYETLVNSCFAYQDAFSGRYFQNILDPQKIEDSNLKFCFLESSVTMSYSDVSVIVQTTRKTGLNSIYSAKTNSNLNPKQNITMACAVKINSGEIVPATITVLI